MTCHCGSCEDRSMDRWKMFDNKEGEAPASLEELAWATTVPPIEGTTQQLVEEAKEYAKVVTESRRQLLTIILTTNENGDRFVVRVQGEGAKVLYDQETGIEPMYLGYVAEDYIIPLRGLLEGLGYDVQEIYI